MLTGSDDPETLERAAAAGGNGLVRKPFSANALLAAVRSRLAPSASDDFALHRLVEDMVREGMADAGVRQAPSAGSSSTLTRALPGAVSAWNVGSALSRPTAPSISAALGIRPSASNSMAAPKSARP